MLQYLDTNKAIGLLDSIYFCFLCCIFPWFENCCFSNNLGNIFIIFFAKFSNSYSGIVSNISLPSLN